MLAPSRSMGDPAAIGDWGSGFCGPFDHCFLHDLISHRSMQDRGNGYTRLGEGEPKLVIQGQLARGRTPLARTVVVAFMSHAEWPRCLDRSGLRDATFV